VSFTVTVVSSFSIARFASRNASLAPEKSDAQREQLIDGSSLPADFETTVLDLKRAVDSGRNPYILDVREPQEYQICRIPGSVLIPLGQVLAPGAAGNTCRNGARRGTLWVAE
jgi:hypothetical protein